MTELLRPSPEDELETFIANVKENVEAGLISPDTAVRMIASKETELKWELDHEWDDLINGIGAM